MTIESTVLLVARPADAAPDSIVGRWHAEAETAAAAVAPLQERVAALEAQRQGYATTLAAACPESNMLELAAAEVGFRVVDRALKPLQGQLETAQRNADTPRQGLGQYWVEYQRLARTAEGYAQARHVVPRELVARIRALVGKGGISPRWVVGPEQRESV